MAKDTKRDVLAMPPETLLFLMWPTHAFINVLAKYTNTPSNCLLRLNKVVVVYEMHLLGRVAFSLAAIISYIQSAFISQLYNTDISL